MSRKNITLSGPHPYTGEEQVCLSLDLYEAAEIRAVNLREIERGKAGDGPGFLPLAGYFELHRESEVGLLLGLVWDLSGQPIFPGGPLRRAADWRLVESAPGKVMVMRAQEECRCVAVEDESFEF
jgi:hypothetical protein